MSNRSQYDRYISVFSPEGKLYQVEYAFKAVKGPGITSIAIRGKDSVIVLSQKKVPDPLMRPESVTQLYTVAADIGLCITGRVPDGHAVASRCRQEAAEYWYKNGENCPGSVLAQRMADHAQLSTQHAGMRPLGVALLFITMELLDDGTYQPAVFKVDPAGYCLPQYAAAVGQKDAEAINYLEKEMKKRAFKEMSMEECARQAIGCLQSVLHQDFKAKDIEVGVVTAENRNFRKVDDATVEGWLTAIAERD